MDGMNTPPLWPANDTRLIEMWNLGISARLIAADIRCSKNSVIGRVHRLHLAARPSPIKPTPAGTPPRQASRPARAPQKPAVQPPRPAVVLVPATAAQPVPTRPVAALSVANPMRDSSDLDCSCRWPIGEPRQAEFHFCEAEAERGRPYCAVHRARARAA